MPLLEIKNLQVEFGSGASAARAVDGVSLSLEAGKTLCLVGESDSGIGVRARSQGTIFDFGCTDSVGPELG
jgi:ABC-type dipeptide/oligopeptide/nickel transport system ATPase component